MRQVQKTFDLRGDEVTEDAAERIEHKIVNIEDPVRRRINAVERA